MHFLRLPRPYAALRVEWNTDGIKCRRICGESLENEGEPTLIVIRRASPRVRWNKLAFEIGSANNAPTETRDRASNTNTRAHALFFGRRRKHGIVLRMRSLAAVHKDILLGSFPKPTTSA